MQRSVRKQNLANREKRTKTERVSTDGEVIKHHSRCHQWAALQRLVFIFCVIWQEKRSAESRPKQEPQITLQISPVFPKAEERPLGFSFSYANSGLVKAIFLREGCNNKFSCSRGFPPKQRVTEEPRKITRKKGREYSSSSHLPRLAAGACCQMDQCCLN